MKLTDYKAERVGPRLVARPQAAGAGGRGRGPGRGRRRGGRSGRRRRRRQADRRAAPAVQARRRGLPARAPHARPRLRRRDEDVVSSSPRAPSTTASRPGRPTASGSPSSATARCPTPTPTRTPTSSWWRPARARSRAPSPRGAGTDRAPAWSPDGQWIAYVAGGDPKDMWYGVEPPGAGARRGRRQPRRSRPTLDRNVAAPRFAPDGRVAAVPARGRRQPAPGPRPGARAAPVERVVAGEREVQAFDVGREAGRGGAREPAAAARRDLAGRARRRSTRVTHVNDAFLKGDPARRGRALPGQEPPTARRSTASSPCPPDTQPGAEAAGHPAHPRRPRRRSTRPASTSSGRCFAAHGYAVIAANPRGSTGLRHATSAARSGRTGATRTSTT